MFKLTPVQGLRLSAKDSIFNYQGSGPRIQVQGLGFRVLGFRDWGLGMRAEGFWLSAYGLL